MSATMRRRTDIKPSWLIQNTDSRAVRASLSLAALLALSSSRSGALPARRAAGPTRSERGLREPRAAARAARSRSRTGAAACGSRSGTRSRSGWRRRCSGAGAPKAQPRAPTRRAAGRRAPRLGSRSTSSARRLSEDNRRARGADRRRAARVDLRLRVPADARLKVYTSDGALEVRGRARPARRADALGRPAARAARAAPTRTSPRSRSTARCHSATASSRGGRGARRCAAKFQTRLGAGARVVNLFSGRGRISLDRSTASTRRPRERERAGRRAASEAAAREGDAGRARPSRPRAPKPRARRDAAGG